MRPETTLLAFDTSGPYCAAALVIDGTRVETRVDDMAKGQAEHLMPMLIAFLGDYGLTLRDLDGIGVGTGPGNFTGIRISVSAARGLALGLGIPAIGVNGFDAQAYGVSRPVTAVIPAPRGQAYIQLLDGGDPALIKIDETVIDGAQALPVPVAAHVANIARLAVERLATPQPRPAPLYVRAADAAPPRDPAPVILG